MTCVFCCRAARVSNSRVPLSVVLRRTSSLVSGGDDASPIGLAGDSVFTARWPTLQRCAVTFDPSRVLPLSYVAEAISWGAAVTID